MSSLTQSSTTVRSFSYDGVGNVTADTRGSTTYNYAYNKRNRLAELTIGSTVTGDYTYDGLERLAIRTTSNMTPAGTTQYVYDLAGHLIAEADSSGNTLTEYVWLDDMPLAVVANVDTSSPNLYFVHTDYLDRPIRMTDTSESVVWDAVYNPFGAVYSVTGAASNNMRFPGQYFLIEDGLNYNWHRHYDATLGRYIQPDPLGFFDGPSIYLYVKANPISGVDPSGLASCTYTISTHTLNCSPNKGGDSVVLGPNGVFSGSGVCRNKNSSVCLRSNFVGPIVPGDYNMNSDDRLGHDTFWRLEPNPKIPGWECRLQISRCGFELHPGGISAGCITADKQDSDTMKQYKGIDDLLKSEGGKNRLRVVP